MKQVEKTMKEEGVTVFIPSSPTPFTGYTITVPREEAIDLPITIDEALRFVVSGGVLVPPREIPDYVSRPGAMKEDGGAAAAAGERHLAERPGDAMMGDPSQSGSAEGSGSARE
jgi:uncharacterized membrane protein